MKHLARNRLVNAVAAVAARCGRLDEAGELGSIGLAMLRSARHRALCAGCQLDDVDIATLDGLDDGRHSASVCGCCGRVYSWRTWTRLQICGELDDRDEPAGELTDWRHCWCGSTLMVEISEFSA